MPDLRTLLSAAAEQQEPGRRPEFATLRARARRRRRLRRIATGVAVALVAGLAIGTIPFLRAWNRPGDGDQAAGRTTIQPSTRAAAVAATVRGGLLRVGGPAGTKPAGLPGTVRFQAEGGEITSVRTADDGTFSITVKPGRYIVTGTSPLFGSGKYECHTEKPVEITAAGLDNVQVICNQR
ncbi:hypothetical protein ACQP2F_31805 [Actinoplanes sp. CA-030573]|uniref:hypothetical protein n=1 Tax=Actinoplanes sp. CA-030573 TaxID=3239898 RepID=UPI003D90045D